MHGLVECAINCIISILDKNELIQTNEVIVILITLNCRKKIAFLINQQCHKILGVLADS